MRLNRLRWLEQIADAGVVPYWRHVHQLWAWLYGYELVEWHEPGWLVRITPKGTLCAEWERARYAARAEGKEGGT